MPMPVELNVRLIRERVNRLYDVWKGDEKLQDVDAMLFMSGDEFPQDVSKTAAFQQWLLGRTLSSTLILVTKDGITLLCPAHDFNTLTSIEHTAAEVPIRVLKHRRNTVISQIPNPILSLLETYRSCQRVGVIGKEKCTGQVIHEWTKLVNDQGTCVQEIDITFYPSVITLLGETPFPMESFGEQDFTPQETSEESAEESIDDASTTGTLTDRNGRVRKRQTLFPTITYGKKRKRTKPDKIRTKGSQFPNTYACKSRSHVLTREPLTPGSCELEGNPRAPSALDFSTPREPFFLVDISQQGSRLHIGPQHLNSKPQHEKHDNDGLSEGGFRLVPFPCPLKYSFRYVAAILLLAASILVALVGSTLLSRIFAPLGGTSWPNRFSTLQMVAQSGNTCDGESSNHLDAAIDFALYATGGRIVPRFTSKGLSGAGSIITRILGAITGDSHDAILGRPEQAIMLGMLTGDCWRFPRPQAQLGIFLAKRITISKIVIDHPSSAHQASFTRSVEVWGLLEGMENGARSRAYMSTHGANESYPETLPLSPRFFLLGSWKYNTTAGIATVLPVSDGIQALALNFQVVVMMIKEDWAEGPPCLYRVRVLGS